MEYNTSFAYPTWDKAYIKLLKPFNGSDVHLTRDEIFSAHYSSIMLTSLVRGGALHKFLEKKGSSTVTYALSSFGKSLYKRALATKPYIELAEFMKQYDTYEEFELNCTLSGNLHWCTHEFYDSIKAYLPNGVLCCAEMKACINKLKKCKLYTVWLDKISKHK